MFRVTVQCQWTRLRLFLLTRGLSNGSTKADPDADDVFAREPRAKSSKCGGGQGQPWLFWLTSG